MTVIMNSFSRRQTADSRFGHFTGSEQELIDRVVGQFANCKPGYRNGVVLVPVSPEGFFSGTVPLKEGMTLKATYEPRRPGETPRMHVGYVPPPSAHGNLIDYEAAKVPAVAVDIVLYASTTLAEGGDNELPAVPGNWEIVSINPRMCEEDEPMPPGTLMANHFEEDGGTATGMTDAAFVAALRRSRAYWNRHVSLG